jgi:hypothetical protein
MIADDILHYLYGINGDVKSAILSTEFPKDQQTAHNTIAEEITEIILGNED